MERFYQERHSSLCLVVEDRVVPGVRNTDTVDGEQPGGVGVQLPGARLNVVLHVILNVDVHRRRKLQNVATHNNVHQQSTVGIQAPGNVSHSQDFSSCKFHLSFSFEDCVGKGKAVDGFSYFLCCCPINGI